MLINLRNALMVGRRLPYDAELEYLESTGTQYIDTGIVSSGFGIRADVVCAQTQSGGEMAIVGRSRGDGFELYSNYAAGKFGLWNRSGNYIELTRQLELSRVYSISAEITTTPTMTLSIDGNVTTKSITSATIADGNILVFKHTSYYFKGRIYSCKIWQNGVLVRDLIPVRVGSGASAVGYMYDRVSKRLFGNAGSGAFVLGPDKAVPILSLHRYASPSNGVALGKMGVGATMMNGWKNPYITDGLIAMWDGEWNAGGGVHDPNATTWKDLAGNADLTMSGAVINANNIFFRRDTPQAYATGNIPYPYGTIECIFSVGSQGYCVVSIGNSAYTGWGICRFAAKIADTYDAASGPYINYSTNGEVVSVAMTKDGVSPATTGIYKNGAAHQDGTVAAGSRYNAGVNSINAPTNQPRCSDVTMYALRIYSRTLTASEIARNYAIDKARFGLP